ncbi:Protein CBR-TRM-1 [Caenorhabditis briggsae]|uniref:tRNA (guanine(26)-N(2))-dimethyltransferase n=1 Tax=Caenorhabditis briggsae TaxID=6238 RepID=A8WYD2_CAEBR|nr:Protein CBR-TRM-1 [Caenorhabditis briggsae]CAP25390.2 Protein CBR-TRM-1 [Caenorhabditis briggsae]
MSSAAGDAENQKIRPKKSSILFKKLLKNNFANLSVSGQAKVGFRGPVFYNPVQEFNRDLTVTVLRQFSDDRQKWHQEQAAKSAAVSNGEGEEPPKKKNKLTINEDGKIRILDALSASGLRALRFSKEVPNVGFIMANDFSDNAVASIQENVKLNEVEDLVEAHFGDAVMTMMEHRGIDKRFHAVDLDPYGTASTFLDSAVQCVADRGILMVTCTDMAVLCGNTPEACYNKYDAVTTRMKCCHEVGLRILLRAIDSAANRYTRYIEPLVSISVDFYVRVFVRVHTGAFQAKQSGTKVGTVLVCSGCNAMEPIPMLKRGENNQENKYSLPTIRHSLTGPNNLCVHCNNRLHQIGPIYLAPIHIDTRSRTTGNSWTSSRRLTMVSEELEEVLYYEHDQMANTVKVSVPKVQSLRSAILHAGFKVSGSHCNPRAIKTNAPMQLLWDIYRQVAKDTSVDREKRLAKESAGYHILGQPITNTINFSLHPGAIEQAKKENLVRFQCNRGKNWGPRQKAKGSVNSTKAGFQLTNVEQHKK